jgi:SAM-dependent methyltransferase
MLNGKRLLVAALAVGAVAVWRYWRRDQRSIVSSLRRFSAPSAAIYDAVSARLLDGFFTEVAADLVESVPRGRVLDVGSGPGRLAARIARMAPALKVTGLDISDEMIERARTVAVVSFVDSRVEFRMGDVASLPFPDASFDAVVSTFSLHHWSDPAQGLSEIYRVLRSGGVARIYDVVDWIRRFEQGGAGIAQLAQESAFGRHGRITIDNALRIGPVPVAYRVELSRERTPVTVGELPRSGTTG